MAIEVKHKHVATGVDAGNGEVHKAEWNDTHAVTMNGMRLMGRTTAGNGAVEEVPILDEDTMASNSATGVPTQQSVKAYVDAQTAAAGSFVLPTVTTIAASATYTPPAGCKWVRFRIQGCGGTGSTGGSASSPVATQGGASGSYAEKVVAAATISSGVFATIAAASSGNATSLGAPLNISVPGASGTSRPGVVTGAVDLAIQGAEGATGEQADSVGRTKGADSMLGFGGGDGKAGTGYGSGGSAGQNGAGDKTGRSGAPGVIIVEEYYS